jgi:hypothetical protein
MAVYYKNYTEKKLCGKNSALCVKRGDARGNHSALQGQYSPLLTFRHHASYI